MSEEQSGIDFNDIHLLAALPYKSIYGVPVGHLVNAIEAGAEEIERLRAEVENWKDLAQSEQRSAQMYASRGGGLGRP